MSSTDGRVQPGSVDWLCVAFGVTCSGLVPLPPVPPIDLGVLSVTFSAPSLLSLFPLRPPTVCTVAVYNTAGWLLPPLDELANERTGRRYADAQIARIERRSIAKQRVGDEAGSKEAVESRGRLQESVDGW